MINPRKQHRREQQLAKQKSDMSGDGRYLFENNTNGDLYLSRPTKEGTRMVKLGAQFEGDDYYFGLLKSGDIKLVRNLKDNPSPERLFVYKNFNRDETKLPEPTRDGQWIIPPTGEFIGDSRYFQLLKTGRLKLLKEVENQMPEKLLTEQPPTVTHQGHVEYVKVDGQQLTEEEKKKKEKILSEEPLEGVKLLLD